MYILYKANYATWDKYGIYHSMEDMLSELINNFGIEELVDCDLDDVDYILDENEFRCEYHNLKSII